MPPTAPPHPGKVRGILIPRDSRRPLLVVHLNEESWLKDALVTISLTENDGCVLEHADGCCVVIYRKSLEGKKALKLSAYMERREKLKGEEKGKSQGEETEVVKPEEKEKEKEGAQDGKTGEKDKGKNDKQKGKDPERERRKQGRQEIKKSRDELLSRKDEEGSSDISTSSDFTESSSESDGDTWSDTESYSESESITEDENEDDFNARASFFTKTDMFGDVLVVKRYTHP